MTTQYRSLYGFGVYAVLAGLTFFLYPTIFDLMGLPPVLDGWARLVGLLALVVGCYYLVNAGSGYRPFALATIIVRFGFAAGVLFLFLSKEMPVAILPFGIIDVLGAIWTYSEIRKK